MDNERSLVNLPTQRDSPFQIWAKQEGIDLELPPSNTKEPTGGAERPGGIVQQRIRCCLGKLPRNLWPEAYHTLSPREYLDRWFHRYLRWYGRVGSTADSTLDLRPRWTNIYAFGCKAYPLHIDHKKGHQKRAFKIRPRAHIGYLVGYHASNIYRIWVPQLKKIPIEEYTPLIQSLELTLKHNSILDDYIEDFNSNILNIPSNDLNSGTQGATDLAPELPTSTTIPVNAGISKIPTNDQGLLTPVGTPNPTGASDPMTDYDRPHETLLPQDNLGLHPSVHRGGDACTTPISTTLEDGTSNPGSASHLGLPGQLEGQQVPMSSTDEAIHTIAPTPSPAPTRQRQPRRSQLELYGNQPIRKSSRTPRPSRRDDIFAALSTLDRPKGNLVTFHAVFAAATAYNALQRAHRDNLTRLPRRYQDLDKHPHGREFKEACHKELHDLIRRGTWKLIARGKAQGNPIPLKWVFTYKFDENGFLIRCKARICVRGDLQSECSDEQTYAAILAARTLRTILSIAAKHDLDIRQFDVANAFLNTTLDGKSPIYVDLPKGYVELGFLHNDEDPTMVAQLNKALYGLRESPLLWYNEISQTLKAQGLLRSAEEPCVFTNGTVLILVYVNDILALSPKGYSVDNLVAYWKGKYELREEPDLCWYLGIRIIRDRPRRTIYLCYDAYIEKTARKFNLADDLANPPAIPIPAVPLTKYEGQATRQEIKAMQERVGSIMYTAVTARPDVAYAASQLSRFLTNPSPKHFEAANQCIQYLYSTRHLAIEYNGRIHGEALVIASDASFADDPESRRSSQGYIIMLYGGPIVWKASLQDTVTTSTTEAELLALERATKESYALERLLQGISADLGPLKLFCDNLQTIRLVVEEGRISTKLRHVDIQNMWLKQEYSKGRFLIEYMPTNTMPADGLTKALPRGKFLHFRALLGLKDVTGRITRPNQ
ncbi:reverse transcriptase family protein [Drechmeria coniospora]|uniref:Reverse transcriptase family protein n=1 Tax=Drechmeria coniospora TaxID=98403 RepID=A0A151GK79_DRECN|nr:reverse transcriptase family protein [Drechmeria coniospora]KYK57498.1 reverse transcriptase family protein [Drechmeria coniospora]